MATDARLSTGLPGHPKTKKLVRRLGPAGGWSLICLILWTRANRPDGDLSGMTAEDIELASDWAGAGEAFVAALAEIRFLDGDAMAYQLHDWAEHQPWSTGSNMRSAKARWNAVKRHHGIGEADRQVPEWAAARATSNAGSTESDASSNAASSPSSKDAAMRAAPSSNAPSPSPSPSPSLNTPLTPQGGGRVATSTRPDQLDLPGADDPLFVAFYAAYPRKTGRADAWKAWRELKATPSLLHDILAGLAKWLVHERWTKDAGKFIKTPGPWLRGRLWEDEEVCGGIAADAATSVPDWVTRAGFDNVAHAANLRCYAHNASQFRNGKRIPAEVPA